MNGTMRGILLTVGLTAATLSLITEQSSLSRVNENQDDML